MGYLKDAWNSLAEELMRVKKEEGLIRLCLVIFAWTFLVLSTLLLAYMIITKTTPSDPNWSLFINQKTLVNWFNILSVIWSIFLFDWMSPGKTISTIMNVNPDSTDEAKKTAMWFLLGFGGLVAYVIKTGT